ncbi:MAG: hypothetical protein PVF84_00820 [Desulfuromonadales bacterium]|jgi:serine/threonine-protein kinase HipA
MQRGRAEAIVEEVRSVVARWRDYAEEANVLLEWRNKIANTHRVKDFE